MPNLVEISDFTGEYQIDSDNFVKAKFDVVRDDHTNDYIYQLLGAELGGLFLDDLDANGVPETARFKTIYNLFAIDDNGLINRSKGIKEYIKGIVFFYYARNNPFNVSIGGNRIKKSQNSDNNVNPNYLVRIYNSSIETGRNIQWYICNNKSDYPEYNGQHLDYVTGL